MIALEVVILLLTLVLGFIIGYAVSWSLHGLAERARDDECDHRKRRDRHYY